MAELHRFAAAGAAIRFQAIHGNVVEDIIPLDIALKRNEHHWLETLPQEVSDLVMDKLYYGHFMCHVFHHDYLEPPTRGL